MVDDGLQLGKLITKELQAKDILINQKEGYIFIKQIFIEEGSKLQ